MASKRETVLAALFARLKAVPGPTVLRGEAMPQRVPAGGLLILRDGEPGEPEVTLSPLTYHYEHAADVEVIVQGDTRDADFDALCVSVGTAVAADRTLGGLCDWIEARAPEPADLPLGDGAEVAKAAVVSLSLLYSTADPLG